MIIADEWCKLCEFDERDGGEEPCIRCTVCGDNKPTQFKPKKPPSNADRIRAMSDEELADFMIRAAQRGGKPTESGLIRWLDWLKREVEE